MRRKIKIEGDHPTFKRFDKTVDNLDDFFNTLDELEEAGYDVKIFPIKKQEFKAHLLINCGCGKSFRVDLNGVEIFKCSCGACYERYYDQKSHQYIINMSNRW